MNPNLESKNCCQRDQKVFLATIGFFAIVVFKVEGIQVHANEGGVTQTRGGVYWLILPAGYLGSSFLGMVLILALTNLLTARWTLRGLCIGLLFLLALYGFCILGYIIVFIGVMNSLFSVYDINIHDDLIRRRVNSSDAEKFAELCSCLCNGAAWGVIWGMISFIFLCGAIYLGLVILS